MNRLYYGDNLEVLRRYITDELIKSIYQGTPFNSHGNYVALD